MHVLNLILIYTLTTVHIYMSQSHYYIIFIMLNNNLVIEIQINVPS